MGAGPDVRTGRAGQTLVYGGPHQMVPGGMEMESTSSIHDWEMVVVTETGRRPRNAPICAHA